MDLQHNARVRTVRSHLLIILIIVPNISHNPFFSSETGLQPLWKALPVLPNHPHNTLTYILRHLNEDPQVPLQVAPAHPLVRLPSAPFALLALLPVQSSSAQVHEPELRQELRRRRVRQTLGNAEWQPGRLNQQEDYGGVRHQGEASADQPDVIDKQALGFNELQERDPQGNRAAQHRSYARVLHQGPHILFQPGLHQVAARLRAVQVA